MNRQHRSDNKVSLTHRRRHKPTRAHAGHSSPRLLQLEMLESRQLLAVMISEIMYHPSSENSLEEYIELHNSGDQPVNLQGWRFTDGVDYTFPNVTIDAGGYLVVAADAAVFAAKYPTVTNSVGNWSGRLSNSSETLELQDAQRMVVDQVAYADEGDWAVRDRITDQYGETGWEWLALHDGGDANGQHGKSLELVHLGLPNESGQNWASSVPDGGTPGAANSQIANEIAPLIADVQHAPAIPKSTDWVFVTASVLDEHAGPVVELFYRRDGASTFQTVPMHDDGESNDGAAGDGIFGAAIPPHGDGDVVEFYVRATDGLSQSRTWPAATTSGQNANALYQVDDQFDLSDHAPGTLMAFYQTMTSVERAEFESITRESNAQKNATIVIVNGTDMDVRYSAGVRIRGSQSRNLNPPPNRINLTSDTPWNGVDQLTFNSNQSSGNRNSVTSHIAGSAIFRLAGLAAADSVGVRMYSNGVDLLGRAYALMETPNSDFVDHHFAEDSRGNFYRGYRPNESPPGSRGAGLQYFGTDPVAYGSYTKITNEGDADWTDVIELTYALNNCGTDGEFRQCVGNEFPENYLEEVNKVVNIDQWLRTLAVIALVDNNENGLLIGDQAGDDYMMYRGADDPRFEFVVHDLDALFANPTRSINRFQGVDALDRLVNHPEIRPRYHAQLLDVIDNVILTDMADATLDEALRGVASQAEIDNVKSFLQARADHVRGLIANTLTVDPGLPLVGAYYQSPTATVVLTGTTPGAETQSVMINGYPATALPGDGSWSFVSTRSGGQSGEALALISVGAEWKYLDDGSDQGTAWRDPQYDDTSWDAGPAQLGYGDGDEDTVVGFIDANPDAGGMQKNATTYFRHTFNVTDATEVASLALRMQYDDGAAVYLNGIEIARTDNLPPNAAFDTYTGQDTPSENQLFDFLLPATALNALVDGTNTMAVEVHQDSPGSSDISFNLELTAELVSGDSQSQFVLHPGINRITVESFAGLHGTGMRLASKTIDVWYDGPAVTTRVDYRPAEVAAVDLRTTDTFVAGVPFLVRIDARDATGRVARELWDAVATLTADNPNVRLTVDQVPLVNGMGSAMVEAVGSGDFLLSAHLGALSDAASLSQRSLEAAVSVSGTLPAGTTTWSGLVQVVDDVIVPENATLELLPGTWVLVDGDAVGAQDSTRLTIHGHLQSIGTAEQPVVWTARHPGEVWGQLDVDGGSADFRYTHIHHAGNAIRQGHTNSGAAIRMQNGAQVNFEHGTMSDLRGKPIYASGGELTVRDSLLTRMVMGPELDDTGLQFHDNWIVDMAGAYHHSGVVDDNDGIYIHSQSPGQQIVLSGGVVAGVQDDGIDTLGSTVTVSDYVIRDVDDKGVSVFEGATTIESALIADADIGISVKANNNESARATIDHVTIARVNRGIGIENDNGQDPLANVQLEVTSSVVRVHPSGDAIFTDYDPADVSIAYSNIQEAWPGDGNVDVDPVFAHPAKHNFRLLPGSPSIDAGQPETIDADGTRTDQGFYRDGLSGMYAPQLLGAETIDQNTILTPWGGPYRVTEDLQVAAGARLMILPGTTVYFAADAELVVHGELMAEGNPLARIRWTSDPAAPHVPDLPGLPDGPPRWDGVHFVDSRSDRNLVSHVDVEYAQDSEGSIGVMDSNAVIDAITVHGTHRNMIYGEDASLVLRNSEFPDMFLEGEMPSALGLDDVAEHVKLEGQIPANGQLVIQNNVFGTNKGHNDVIDAESGHAPGPILQVLDNVFLGGGDELLDLNGDAFIAGNWFTGVFKTDETPDSGYASVISAGAGTEQDSTIVVVRNFFVDVDHALNLKDETFALFENNTVHRVHPDFEDRFGQLNIGSAINLFVDEPNASPGRGAYVEGNIFYDLPRVFGNVDQPDGTTSILNFHHNVIDEALMEASVGTRPGKLLDLGVNNFAGDPRFEDWTTDDFRLDAGSPAIGSGPLGRNVGATVRAGIWIAGEPPRRTSSTSAQLTVGGPGLVAYQYRVDGGPWSEELAIGTGWSIDGEIVRTSNILLSGLEPGDHSLQVRGKDFAGTWQPEATTSAIWTVVSNNAQLRIHEVLASNQGVFSYQGRSPDFIELVNDGAAVVDLSGMSITDDATDPTRFVFPAGTQLLPGQFLTLIADDPAPGDSDIALGFKLSDEGESVFLFHSAANGSALIDSVQFGMQLPDRSIGRVGRAGTWMLNEPTPGSENRMQRTGRADGVVINEWLTSGDVRVDNDFVELYNPDELPVSLDGLYLTDNPNALPQMFPIAPLSFIDAKGARAFVADGDPEDGPDHLNFRLSSVHETIALVNSRSEVLDRVMYYGQFTDISQGRSFDGGPDYVYTSLPTPGLSNAYATMPGTHLDLIEGLRISEVMYHPGDDTGSEFVELVNIGQQPLALGGVRIRGGIDVVLSETTLDPGEHVVVVQNPSEFIAKYGTTPRIVGQFSGALNNAGEELVLELPSPLDVAVLRFTYDDAWYTSTDGAGPALEILDVQRSYTSWGDPASWHAGMITGGTPGRSPSDWPPQPGDVNADGQADIHDLERVLSAVKTPDHSYDLDGNLMVDSADVQWLVEQYLHTLMGDANLDRRVDGTDLNIWSAHRWQSGATTWSTGDFNADGVIDGLDFNIWNRHKFLATDASRSVPVRIPRAAGALGVASTTAPQFAEPVTPASPARHLATFVHRRNPVASIPVHRPSVAAWSAEHAVAAGISLPSPPESTRVSGTQVRVRLDSRTLSQVSCDPIELHEAIDDVFKQWARSEKPWQDMW